jgi:hypothetical protein
MENQRINSIALAFLEYLSICEHILMHTSFR